VVDYVLSDARIIAARKNEADGGAGVFGQPGEGADGEVDVLLRLETVDGEDDVCVLPGKGIIIRRLNRLVRDVDAGVDDRQRASGSEGRPLHSDDRFSERRVYRDGRRKRHAPFFPSVEREAVQRFIPLLPPLGEEQVGEVAVEEGSDIGVEGLEEGKPGGELVGEEDGGGEGGEFGGQADLEDEVDLAEDGAEDGEAREDGGGDYGVSPDADVEGACNY
jgi:hypothetical protein